MVALTIPVGGGPADKATPITGVDTSAEVLTVEEAAEFLRVGRNALYDAIGRGEVPHRRIGKQIRLSRSAIVRWLSRSCSVAEEEL